MKERHSNRKNNYRFKNWKRNCNRNEGTGPTGKQKWMTKQQERKQQQKQEQEQQLQEHELKQQHIRDNTIIVIATLTEGNKRKYNYTIYSDVLEKMSLAQLKGL